MASILFITGYPGSGKSTVGRKLAESFDRCVHLQVDAIRESMVSGFAEPGEFTENVQLQFRLAREVATFWANSYAANGIHVVLDDVCIPETFTEHYGKLFAQANVHQILLNPNEKILKNRILQRGGPYAEFFVKEGLPYITQLLGAMPKENWSVIDSSDQTAEETTLQILQLLPS